MTRVLLSWIGRTDLDSAKDGADGPGPLGSVVTNRAFDRIELLYNYSPEEVSGFLSWLGKRTDAPVAAHYFALESPIDYEAIYRAAVTRLETINEEQSSELPYFTFHLSSGTGAMEAVWVLLGKTSFKAELLQSSTQRGVVAPKLPFEISLDFLPSLLAEPDRRLARLSEGLPPPTPEFKQIIHQSEGMKRVITKARRVALRKISVVIEGESGTGKELLARAIHYSSPRKRGPFQAKNCGAIPADLVESDLFGHEKGAFSGAHATHRGVFEVANGGTVFLDEIGELPLLAQVKLLRVLAEGEVTRLGSTTSLRVDVRIIAATNRKLVDEMQAGRFREDLFHRLAGLVVTLPPLRERTEDIPLLLDEMLTRVNKECESEPGYEPKVLSVAARTHAKHYRWPGNVRELYSTLLRAAVFTPGSRIELADFQEALLAVDNHPRDHLLERPLGDGFSLPKLLSEVERHYLSRGMDEAGKNMTQAAELLGFASYQTLSNRLKKNGLYS